MRATAVQRAHRSVLRWCDWYTRDLEPAIAGARRDELESDLHEQLRWQKEQKTEPAVMAVSILDRFARGVPADLLWRRTQRATQLAADPSALRQHRIERTTLLVALASVAALMLFGGYVVTRVAVGIVVGDVRPGSFTSVSVLIFGTIGLCGLVLLLRRKTRFLGALWLVPATMGVIHYGFSTLWLLSATTQALVTYTPQYQSTITTLAVGFSLLFIASAVWWWPSTATQAPATPSVPPGKVTL